MAKEIQYFIEIFNRKIKQMPDIKHYRPLKITFQLASPLMLSHPWLHFDAVILYLFLLQIFQERFFLLPKKNNIFSHIKQDWRSKFPIFIDSYNLVYSSTSIFQCQSPRLKYIFKRFEDRWIRSKRKIPRGSGYFKDFYIQNLYFPISEFYFYVFGNPEYLEDYCRKIIALGDNTRIGWGRVKNFQIQEEGDQNSSIMKDGFAMRPIPIAWLKSYSDQAYLGWKPPYCFHENITLCAPPGAKISFLGGNSNA